MEHIMTLVWLGILVLTLIAEATTAGLVAIWFSPGALIAMIVALCNANFLWQICIFLVVSIVTLIFGRKFCKPLFQKTKTNVDALVGQTAIITEEVHNLEGKGAAKIQGKEWSARAEQDDTVLETGSHVEIVAIQGVKLICRKK